VKQQNGKNGSGPICAARANRMTALHSESVGLLVRATLGV
jgi:hypothetical protein